MPEVDREEIEKMVESGTCRCGTRLEGLNTEDGLILVNWLVCHTCRTRFEMCVGRFRGFSSASDRREFERNNVLLATYEEPNPWYIHELKEQFGAEKGNPHA